MKCADFSKFQEVDIMDIPPINLQLAEKIQECQEKYGKTKGYRKVHI